MTGADASTRSPDVLVVGAGPAGLGTAIACARRGWKVTVLERNRRRPIDKACGEGLMPDAVRQLADWGVRPEGRALRGIRYRDEQTSVDGSFPAGAGLGTRRTALSSALLEGANRRGVEVHLGDGMEELRRDGARWQLRSTSGEWRPAVLVGADGLRSPLRRSAGLERGHRGRRVGIRRHFRVPEGSEIDRVEVIWGDGVEAYLTPVGDTEVGIALLEDPRRRDGEKRRRSGDRDARSAFDRAAARVPGLTRWLDGLEPTTRTAGSGPLRARAFAPVLGNLALVGDAGGYVDAITGEGLAIAFAEAEALALALEQAAGPAGRGQVGRDGMSGGRGVPLEERAVHGALRRFARSSRRIRRLPDLVTHGALMLAARPSLRRRFLRALARRPARFDRLLALHVRAGSDWSAVPVAARLAWGLLRSG